MAVDDAEVDEAVRAVVASRAPLRLLERFDGLEIAPAAFQDDPKIAPCGCAIVIDRNCTAHNRFCARELSVLQTTCHKIEQAMNVRRIQLDRMLVCSDRVLRSSKGVKDRPDAEVHRPFVAFGVDRLAHPCQRIV